MTHEQRKHMDSLKEQHDTPMVGADNITRKYPDNYGIGMKQMTQVKVVRTDKHTQEIKSLSVTDAVLELASIMPASIYGSRMEIAFDLAAKGHIETLGYLYELTASNYGQAPDLVPVAAQRNI